MENARSARGTRSRTAILAFAAAVALSCGTTPPTGPAGPTASNPPGGSHAAGGSASPGSPTLPPGSGIDPAAIASRVTTGSLASTLDKLAEIARSNGGTRRTGGPGDAATAQYLEATLADLGYTVEGDAFEMPVFSDGNANELSVIGPEARPFEPGKEFGPFMFSPAGTVEGPVFDLGWDPRATTLDGRGCDPADFAGVQAGAIVLVRPGPCARRTAIINAQGAGGAGLVSAIPWSGLGEVRRATLLDPDGLRIPGIAADRDVGAALAAAAVSGTPVRLVVSGSTSSGTVRSVVAESTGLDRSRVVIVGAHLDSSMDGPGVNDDGSGVAAIVALARALAGTRPPITIRFAFWAGEESGLNGSTRYVAAHAPSSSERIVAYLNLDMIGSPNGFRGVYDEATAAAGSAAIRDLFTADLDAQGLAWEGTDLGAGSDHSPFARAGVPTGGLFSGTNEPLTGEQAKRYGGEAGQPADPCYHLACDGRDNVDEQLMLELARSFARVTVELASGG